MEHLAPDREFVQQLIRIGGRSPKKCMQCGTCSVICLLSPSEQPFPRKEMLWAAWGLRDRLLADPDVWLCHRCEDCSSHCPRDANPGDVLAAIRHYSVVHFAVPSFLAKACLEPRYLLLLLLLPTIVLLGALLLAGRLELPAGEIVFAHFIPSLWVQLGALVFLVPALLAAMISLWRFWRSIGRFRTSAAAATVEDGTVARAPESGGATLLAALLDILSHRNFQQCGENRDNLLAHRLTFAGFVLLTLATLGRAIYEKLLGLEKGLPLTDPVKLIGNVGGLLVLVGCGLTIYIRLAKERRYGRGTYFDWSFVGALVLASVTGLLTQWARFAGVTPAAYWIYVVHLAFVFALLVYAPYSKFAHAAYRALAMVRARQIGRSQVRQERSEKGVDEAASPAVAGRI